MKHISLVFPMAGEGARFGYRFKPFLDFDGATFIEAAVAPFRPWLRQIDGIRFVYLRAQEEAHDVSNRLRRMFPDVAFDCVLLDQPTPGPAETLAQCLAKADLRGPVVACDCDHQLDVTLLMRTPIDRPLAACALPTWDISNESLAAWSVAGIDDTGQVLSIGEKCMPPRGESFRGVIGCYYFADADHLRRIAAAHRPVYLSDIVRHLIAEGRSVVSVPIASARFFGDPVRLQQERDRAPTTPAAEFSLGGIFRPAG